MPIFLVKKRQTGLDGHGDCFSWQNEEWYVSATDKETLLENMALVNGVEIYAREYLDLQFVGEVETTQKAYALRQQLSGYFIQESLLDKLS